MNYLDLVRSHFDRLLSHGLATGYGPDPCPMWMASLDTRTGRYPADDARPVLIPKRVYRNIDAPRGCSAYWDQPQLAAAHALSRVTGESTYAAAADDYIRAFLDRCVSGTTGLLLWGNHYYWDAFLGRTTFFKSEETPQPVDPATESGWCHEVRPIMPEWELMWRISPAKVERAILAMAEHHLVDPATGAFNRHADGKLAHAFLEAGGILVESFCWLAARTGRRELAALAVRVARFSFDSRHAGTGLLPTNATSARWDRHTATTEVGHWAGSLLRAAKLSGRRELSAMAGDAVGAFAECAWDEKAGRYFGRLRIEDGSPILGPRTTPYQPGEYSDLWEPLFPAHDYLLAMADACCELMDVPACAAVIPRVVRLLELAIERPPATYAEHMGRAILFLLRAAKIEDAARRIELAQRWADHACATLFDHGMFRTHEGEDRYDAVDGAGFLLQGLLELHSGSRDR